MDKERVLFLCTGNSARSQMAEAFLRDYAGDRYEVHSAGLEPQGINPYTVKVLNEIGIDISDHRSKSVREYMGHVIFTYVITVCDHAEEHCPTIFVQQSNHLHWSFEDPAALAGSSEGKMVKFREVRDRIRNQVQRWVDEKAISNA